jgi:hypothetical protein
MMILKRIYTWRNAIFSINAETDANTSDSQQIDLDAKFREEETWLGIG